MLECGVKVVNDFYSIFYKAHQGFGGGMVMEGVVLLLVLGSSVSGQG